MIKRPPQGGDGTERQVGIPALMVSQAAAALLKTCARDHPATPVRLAMTTRPAPPLAEPAALAAAVQAALAPGGSTGEESLAASGNSGSPAPAEASSATSEGTSLFPPSWIGPRGSPWHFQYTALGAWSLMIQERDRVFHLHLVPGP